MVRVAIVGAGVRGRLFARALGDQSDVLVTGFAEPNGVTATAVHEETGLPVFASHRELFEQTAPDAAIIATPDFAHRDAAVDAAERGLHILLEKPVATNLADARAIEEAITRAGVQCMVGFENRWNPHCVRAHEAVEQGNLGRVISQSATLSNSYYVPTRMLPWAARSSPAWFLMPHTVDLMLWLSGRTPATVTATGHRGVLAARGVDTWDVVHALITFDDGTTANATSAWILPDSSPAIVDFTFSVLGDAGSVKADLSNQGLVQADTAWHSLWPVGGDVNGELIGAPVWMARNFARALRDGTPVGPTIRDGVRVTEVICAIEESLARRETVALPLP
jgi:predicted dehydrogenase